MESAPDRSPSNFLREQIEADLEAGRYGGRVATRFPPEPNGYPHIGHAQSICLNFGLAERFGGTCNLRYDDTNPETEDAEFVEALEDAVRWLGFEPAHVRFASDYFEQFYTWAQELVRKGLAYVDSQTEAEIREHRGTVTEPGTPSPFRDRPAEESLKLLDEMRRGEHPDGSHVLRAKIDTEHGPLAHPNMKLRDPLMYRIRRDVHHYRQGDAWAIYPLYDWAHGQGDAIEGITHSICTLEFDVNRPLYDWYLDAIGIPEPRNHQYEFARFNLEFAMTSKRKLRRLVEEGHVRGWDDPRMPTIAGIRRRGVRPQAVRAFFDGLGVTKVNGYTELAQFQHAVRDDLNHTARRVLAVTRPLKLALQGPDGAPLQETTWTDAPYWPHDVTPPEDAPATRRLPLGGTLWIERGDFAERPPKGWKRLAPGASVRLRHGPVVTCTGMKRGPEGEVVAVQARVDDTAKPKGVIHWLDAEHALPATFRLYDRLFTHPDPGSLDDFLSALNPDSLVETEGYVEPSVADDPPETRYQFERLGYFWQDPQDSAPDALVFNRIVPLRDSWGRKAEPAPKAARPKPAPQPSGPRDPAAALSEAQRTVYDALGARGVGDEEAAVLAAEPAWRALFESVVALRDAPREAAVLLVHEVRPALGERALKSVPATPEAWADLIGLVGDGTITRQAAGTVVETLLERGGSARGVVEAQGLAAVRDADALGPVVDAVLQAHPDEVARYRGGEKKLLGFFMGQAMRGAPKGTDAQALRKLLQDRLG